MLQSLQHGRGRQGATGMGFPGQILAACLVPHTADSLAALRKDKHKAQGQLLPSHWPCDDCQIRERSGLEPTKQATPALGESSLPLCQILSTSLLSYNGCARKLGLQHEGEGPPARSAHCAGSPSGHRAGGKGLWLALPWAPRVTPTPCHGTQCADTLRLLILNILSDLLPIDSTGHCLSLQACLSVP